MHPVASYEGCISTISQAPLFRATLRQPKPLTFGHFSERRFQKPENCRDRASGAGKRDQSATQFGQQCTELAVKLRGMVRLNPETCQIDDVLLSFAGVAMATPWSSRIEGLPDCWRCPYDALAPTASHTADIVHCRLHPACHPTVSPRHISLPGTPCKKVGLARDILGSDTEADEIKGDHGDRALMFCRAQSGGASRTRARKKVNSNMQSRPHPHPHPQ